MDFEPTSELNVERLTTCQHFHMRAILKRFDTELGIRVQYKASGDVEYLEPDSPAFVGMRSWSQEAEVAISAPIEDRFIKEVQRLVQGGSVNNHKALSRYHLLWTLRHRYAKHPKIDTALFPSECGSLPKDAEEWLEARNKVPVRQGGVVPGRFMTAQSLKDDLNYEANIAVYEGVVWTVIRSPDARLISADCYGDCLLMVVDPHLALQGQYSKRPAAPKIIGIDDAANLNRRSLQSAVDFTFG